MKKVLVLYYSRSGNTEKMAKAIAEGAQGVSDTAVEVSYHLDDASELSNYDAIVIGAPTYRKEYPIDFKNLFEEAEAKKLKPKRQIRRSLWQLRLERRSTPTGPRRLKSQV